MGSKLTRGGYPQTILLASTLATMTRVNPSSVLIDVQLVEHPVMVTERLPLPLGTGAECVFLGRTRLDTHPVHGALKRLSYEAYREMAENVLRDLSQQAIDTFGCIAVRIHHALGEVPIGEASVLVQVACGHRDKAFEACRFLIDRLKSHAPIWKREVWEHGETWSDAASVITATHSHNQGFQ